MPGGQNGTPPEMPSGDNQGVRPQMPDREQKDSENGNFEPPTNDKQSPSGQPEEMRPEDNENTDLQNKKQTDNSFDAETRLLIAISIFVLAVGLIVVLKKK